MLNWWYKTHIAYDLLLSEQLRHAWFLFLVSFSLGCRSVLIISVILRGVRLDTSLRVPVGFAKERQTRVFVCWVQVGLVLVTFHELLWNNHREVILACHCVIFRRMRAIQDLTAIHIAPYSIRLLQSLHLVRVVSTRCALLIICKVICWRHVQVMMLIMQRCGRLFSSKNHDLIEHCIL